MGRDQPGGEANASPRERFESSGGRTVLAQLDAELVGLASRVFATDAQRSAA